MSTECPFKDSPRIEWYRTPLERAELTALTQRSDVQGLRQSLGHLGLGILTGIAAFMVFKQVNAQTWPWAVPLLLVALFVHSTICSFFGGVACHELGHGTVFKTKWLNAFFLRLFAFLSWWDFIWFRPSHFKHHQVTVHHDYDGEVVLPQHFNFKDWRFWVAQFAWNPMGTWGAIKTVARRAAGKLDNEWYAFVMPEDNEALRRRHRNWARLFLALHAVLAVTFIATGNWILVFLVNIPTHACGWLGFLCGNPQHYGMQPDVADHRKSCRTYITRGLPAFLYWNMQYHIEHHMYPGVPFYNLPKLRKAIEHDLPPAPNGLWATWKELLAIHRKQKDDPDYFMEVELPESHGAARASVDDLGGEMSVA